jgi:LPXTG-motif cell wall-anchored protein
LYVDSNETTGNSYSYYVVAVNAVGAGTSSVVQSVGPSTGGTGSSDNTALFAGVGIVVIVIIIAGVFLYMRRKK